MSLDKSEDEKNVDHFLISTRENQLLLIFINQIDVDKEVFNIWED